VKHGLRQALPAVVGLALFVVALEVLRVELRAVSWHELTRDVLDTPPTRLLLALGGLSFVVSPIPSAQGLPGHQIVFLVGGLLMLAVAAYVIATIVRREPLRLRSFVVPLPSPRLATGQLLISALDWALAGTVL
jgi:uncharacterized membrane protein YbhN (UPF0104 family)